MKHVVIVGAGAMGCLFAARLAEVGLNVSLVDIDQERLSAINAQGVRVVDEQGRRDIRVRALAASETEGPVDLVMLFTKGMHTAAATQSVANLAEHAPVALTLQNGLGNAEVLADVFSAERVLMGTAHLPADLHPQCEVRTQGFGTIDLGGFSEAARPHSNVVVELLVHAGFEARARPDITEAIWAKVAFNAALNPLGAVCDAPNGALDNDFGRRIARSVVDETVAVATAKGVRIDAEEVFATVVKALEEHKDHCASMTQDRRAGRMSEIEAINGAICREGARYGVPTPVCETLADLMRIIERDG